MYVIRKVILYEQTQIAPALVFYKDVSEHYM